MKLSLTILVVFDGIAWILGFIPPLRYLFVHRSFPTWMGIRLLDGGPFSRLNIDSIIIAGLLFIIISAFKLLAAYWLWHTKMDGAILELILLGLSAIFWYGFALPFGPPIGLAEVILIILVWGKLH